MTMKGRRWINLRPFLRPFAGRNLRRIYDSRYVALYFTAQAIYVPTPALYAAGIWTELNPVAQLEADDWQTLAAIIGERLAKPPAIYRTPFTRFSYPPWVMLAAMKKRYPKQISDTAIQGRIETTAQGWRLSLARANQNNEWVEIEGEIIMLSQDASAQTMASYFQERINTIN